MSITAFVFPGQGSQSIGMLSDLSDRFPLIIEIFDKVSEHLKFDVWQLVQSGPEDILNQNTQIDCLIEKDERVKIIDFKIEKDEDKANEAESTEPLKYEAVIA